MRVLLSLRLDARQKYGGDVRIAEMYARGLRRLGCEAVVSDRLHENYAAFDIVHFSSLNRCFEIALRLRRIRALRRRPRTVLMPFHHKIEWLVPYYRACLGTNVGEARDQGALRFDALITAKDVVRYVQLLRYHLSLLRYATAYRSTFRQNRFIVDRVDALLVHAEAEAASVRSDFRAGPTPWFQVMIGQDEGSPGPLDHALPSAYLLSVGRIEPLKNQLGLIEAARPLGIPVVCVGAINRRHTGFVRRFHAALDPRRVIHIPHADRPTLDALYRGARLHVNASWVEVFPVTNVEAAANGCRFMTTTCSYERDVYGDGLCYVRPDDVPALRAAIERTLVDPGLGTAALVSRHVPSWQAAAAHLLDVYHRVERRD